VGESYRKPEPEVTERMRRVKSAETGLEKAMEDILTSLGIEYEKQLNLPGKPDFRIKGTNILIFCDSSFWHGRRDKDVSGKTFNRNKNLWVEKLERNKKRDQRINRKLRKEGFSVHRFWDTDILSERNKVIKRLKRLLNG
jgi:DNA mismatch endonuclease (patch repair protein)